MKNCDNKEELQLIQYFKTNRKEALIDFFDYLKKQEYDHSIRYSEELLDEIFCDKEDEFCGPRVLKKDIVALLQDPSVKNDCLNAIKKLDFENFNEYQLVMTDELLDMLRVVTTQNRGFKMNFILGHDLDEYIDLSHKDFKGIIFEDEVVFPKCRLDHSSFRGSKGAKIFLDKCHKDMSYSDYCDAFLLKDGWNSYGEIKDKEIHHSNFDGCKSELYIYPQTIPSRNCSYVKFGKSYIFQEIGASSGHALDFCTINHSDFSKCPSIYSGKQISTYLDPQTVPDKDCSYVKFGIINFVNTLDYCKIIYSDFHNSTNAQFNPQTIPNKDLSGVKLSDVTLTGPLDGCILNDTDFGGIKSLCTVDINTVTYNENTNFAGVNVVGYDPSIHLFNPTIEVAKNKEKVYSLFAGAKKS